MATYSQVGYGSKGSTVTELQKLLNQNGYSLDTDGIFGSKTQAAVKDYQQKNNLSVDGIVGNNTWGVLTKAAGGSSSGSPGTSTETATPGEPTAPAVDTNAYKPSDTVAQAEALLQQQLAQKPGAYQSTWEGQLNDIIQQILNREDFSYDLNGDALYQQYADQYATQGKLAMMDTMGQAQAMTGGYGNSYAQSVGQQAYQSYLQQLNDVVPELYGMALDQYNQEGQALYDQAGLMAQMEDQEYGRYMDGMNAYYNELDYLTGRYDTERDADYSRWYNDYLLKYQTERDQVADQQWQAQFDEAKRQYDQQYALSASKGSGSSGGGGGSYTGGGYKAPVEDNKTPTVDTSGVNSTITNKASSFTNNGDLANYLDGLTASGSITEAQADALYAQYKQPDMSALNNRSWTLVDGGGVNWLWGIDNNAVVKDQYGNTYRLDKLVDALVAEGMDKNAAKEYVKNLQKQLGA